MSEEYHRGFTREVTQLFSSPRTWSEHDFLMVFVFGFGAMWVVAGAGALYGFRIANFMLWFYALGAGLLNAMSHFVFPLIKGGYFPGLYTAAGHLVLSITLVVMLMREARDVAASGHTPAAALPLRELAG